MRTLRAARPFLALLSAVALLLAACDMPWRVAGGSGTETSNGEVVAGRVLMGDGKPASGASVYVRTAAYLKDTVGIDSLPPPADAVTDKEGYFRLKFLTAGSYKAEVRDGKERPRSSASNSRRSPRPWSWFPKPFSRWESCRARPNLLPA